MIEQCEMSTRIGEPRLDLWRTYRTPRAVHFYGSQPRNLRSMQKMAEINSGKRMMHIMIHSLPFTAHWIAKYFTHVYSR